MPFDMVEVSCGDAPGVDLGAQRVGLAALGLGLGGAVDEMARDAQLARLEGGAGAGEERAEAAGEARDLPRQRARAAPA